MSHGKKLLMGVVAATLCLAAPALAAPQPNIVVIMGDDIGWYNIGAYHQGMMAGRTPNLDRLSKEGVRFTDYYAEASCTAGRANFITGQLPIRTGMTTVGQAGAKVGLPGEACTIASALKSMGYATGQFGKNHLGDLNEFLIGSYQYFDWFRFEFWRFVFVQQQVAKLAMTAIEYPPMQKGASFNLEAVKAKIAEAMRQHEGQ